MARVGFEFEFATNMSDKEVKKKLKEKLGIQVKSYGTKNWRLDDDVSIEPRRHVSLSNCYDNRCELVSPPMRVDKALKVLKQVFEFMKEENIETNTTTGLHVNMDIGATATSRINGTKLIALVDEEKIAKRYGRSRQMYCLPRNSKIRQTVKYYDKLKNKPCSKKDYVKRWALTQEELEEKYTAINFIPRDQGYLEFRMIGNTDYQYKYTKIKNDIKHFEACMRKAADKKAGEKQLTRRLNQIVT
jgi:hypothetical protein